MQLSSFSWKHPGSALQTLVTTFEINSKASQAGVESGSCGAVQAYSEPGALASSSSDHRLAVAAQSLFGDMARSGAPVTPFTFLFTLRQVRLDDVFMPCVAKNVIHCWTRSESILDQNGMASMTELAGPARGWIGSYVSNCPMEP